MKPVAFTASLGRAVVFMTGFLFGLSSAIQAHASDRVATFESLAKDIPGYQRLASHPTAPQVPFVDALGTPLTLSDFRGRVVVLNFWATWCPPCRREMPSLIRLQNALSGPDLEVVAVSTDRAGASVVAPYLKRAGLTDLEIFLDPRSKLLRAFESSTLPTTIIIDKDGRALGGVMGALEWDSPEVIKALRVLSAAPLDDNPTQNAELH